MLFFVGACFASLVYGYYELGWAAYAVILGIVMGSLGLVFEAAESRVEQRPVDRKAVVASLVMLAGGMIGAIALTVFG
jgi:hypothetical protein